ncbi:hypothetical protein NP233_g3258 [Leucocoprinus birnbaumii]|uniref:F-box domain-containing protein n=1 Tax=Leucocoprinus birnbaumii TaxID=56174 RepID=A0AAD5W3D0_9AGAR|nr:hypothetical protein NP233_g3258 [Leucocoprinus birnbaumii]
MEGDIRYFLKTAERLGDDILKIQHEQASLLQSFNNLHSATRSLPPFVLAEVFHYVCKDAPLYEDMLINYPAVQVISRVCSQWRQVAWTSPVLWTRVLLRFKAPGSWASNNSFAMLKLHSANSGELALDIVLDIPDKYSSFCRRDEGSGWERHYTTFTTIFYFIFIENPSRLGSLVLTRSGDMPKIWLELIQSYTTYPLAHNLSTNGYPNLTKLEFRPGNGMVASEWKEADAHHLFKDTPVPRLASVSIQNREWLIRFPYRDLTALHLKYFPVNQCIDFLINCPRLTSFYQSSCMKPVPSEVKPPRNILDSPLVLSNLEDLEWSLGFRDWDVYLMTQFRFPSLSTLQIGHFECPALWREPRSTEADVDIYWAPFLASLTKLKSISIDTELFTLASFELLWEPLSRLDQLGFLHITCEGNPAAAGQTKSIIGPLTLDTNPNPSQFTPLPHLTALQIDMGHIKCLEGNAEPFLLLLESRAQSSQVPSIKSVDFRDHPYPTFGEERPVWTTWSDEQRRRLVVLTEGGLKLILTQERMYWDND